MLHRKRNNPGQQIAAFLNLSMAAAYLFSGGYLLVSSTAGKLIPAEYTKTIGAAIIIYGFFRLHRAYTQLNSRQIQ
jgi:hypothetical protein